MIDRYGETPLFPMGLTITRPTWKPRQLIAHGGHALTSRFSELITTKAGGMSERSCHPIRSAMVQIQCSRNGCAARLVSTQDFSWCRFRLIFGFREPVGKFLHHRALGAAHQTMTFHFCSTAWTASIPRQNLHRLAVRRKSELCVERRAKRSEAIARERHCLFRHRSTEVDANDNRLNRQTKTTL